MIDEHVYDSSRRPSPVLEELLEAVRYRDLVAQFVRRDIVTRYKRSVLGVLWTMLSPLGMMLVLTVVFSQLFKTTEAYPVYLLSGLIVWTFFAQSTVAAMRYFIWGGGLIQRVYIPKTLFAISAVGAGLVNLLLSMIPLFLVMLAVGYAPRLPVLFLPVAIVLLAAFALGVGLLFTTIAAYFPDFVEIYEIGLMAWMYLTPIFYPEEIIPASFSFWLFNLNPMFHLIRLFRAPIYFGVWPMPERLAAAAVAGLGALLIGWVVFTKKADEFAYRI